MPLSYHDRNPAAAKDLESAYAEAVSQSNATGTVGRTALGSAIADSVSEQRQNSTLTGIGLETISDLETKQAFSDRFEATTRLFDLENIDTPTPEEMEEAGIDFGKLGALYEKMQHQGKRPEILITPSIGLTTWESICRKTVIEPRGGVEPLYTSIHMRTKWDDLNDAMPNSVTRVTQSDGALDWTIRLMPTANDHAEAHVGPWSASLNWEYPTLNEYLTLQTLRFQAKEKPALHEKTWLAGTFESTSIYSPMKFAPSGIYGDGGDMIDLIYDDITKSMQAISRRMEWVVAGGRTVPEGFAYAA